MERLKQALLDGPDNERLLALDDDEIFPQWLTQAMHEAAADGAVLVEIRFGAKWGMQDYLPRELLGYFSEEPDSSALRLLIVLEEATAHFPDTAESRKASLCSSSGGSTVPPGGQQANERLLNGATLPFSETFLMSKSGSLTQRACAGTLRIAPRILSSRIDAA